MNSEFAENALQSIEPLRTWPVYDLAAPTKKPFDLHAAENVLGYTPVNRKDRRKATKLLKSKRY